KTAPEIQVKRVMKKTGLNAREIARRIKNQMPLSRKLEMADYIVDNSGSKKKLESTVKKIWEEIKSGRK
ncbi:MAG: dephospho-CoA kinase, partial [Candidatus Omnitrophota bacterium]|nr:dephospho-CoA kinase [Candidatus Omnitrophota bacterium]